MTSEKYKREHKYGVAVEMDTSLVILDTYLTKRELVFGYEGWRKFAELHSEPEPIPIRIVRKQKKMNGTLLDEVFRDRLALD